MHSIIIQYKHHRKLQKQDFKTEIKNNKLSISFYILVVNTSQYYLKKDIYRYMSIKKKFINADPKFTKLYTLSLVQLTVGHLDLHNIRTLTP